LSILSSQNKDFANYVSRAFHITMVIMDLPNDESELRSKKMKKSSRDRKKRMNVEGDSFQRIINKPYNYYKCKDLKRNLIYLYK
jgi:hypothetical protein